MDLSSLGHTKIKAMLSSLTAEAKGGLSTRLTSEILAGPLRDAHSADAAPVEFDHFDTGAGIGAGIITGTVGGPDLELYATTAATNEAGLVIIDSAASSMWSVAGGAGGWLGWGVVKVEYGLAGTGTFQATYNATPTGGYGTTRVFAHDFKGHRHYPLKGRTISSGGGITCKLTMRALGAVPGVTVVWPGADLFGISSAACTLIQKMIPLDSANYGPIHLKALFPKGDGRKATITRLFGNGRIAKVLDGAKAFIGGE